MLSNIFVIFFSFLGLLLSLYIRHKKQHRETHLVCPLKGDCKQVIFSEYATFFGFPVELLGLLYYALVTSGYILIVLMPQTYGWLPNVLMPITITALLFSSYLTCIQLFQIKQICTWCLTSAALCLGIFLLAFIPAREQVIPFLATQASWILVVHGIGAAIGLGAATLTDVFFFRFLKDQRISEFEAEILRTFSQVIWVALAVMVVSGLGLYLPHAAELNHSAKFLVKMIGLIVIIGNGTVLNLLITPKLVKIAFGNGARQSPDLARARRLAFACGPISLVSWYTVFVLGAFAHVRMGFLSLFGMYVILLLLGIVVGQIAGSKINQRSIS